MISGEQKKKIAALCQEELKRLTGKGPSEIVITAVSGFINIRCDGFMTHIEQSLAKCTDGDKLVVAIRKRLFDNVKENITNQVEEIISAKPSYFFDDYLPSEDSQSISIIYDLK